MNNQIIDRKISLCILIILAFAIFPQYIMSYQKEDSSNKISNGQIDQIETITNEIGVMKDDIQSESTTPHEYSLEDVQTNYHRSIDPKSKHDAFELKTLEILYNQSGEISIIGDGGFSGFPGAGTLNDPYRIEGWNITASSGNLIYVSGTTAHFTIKNNLLNGMTTAFRGIYLLNVVNGTIENNYVGNFTSSGIRMESSSNNTIADNTVYNNQGWAGVEIRYSSDINIINNTVFNNYNGNGISLYSSNDNLLANNTAHSNNYRGIRLEYSNNNEISNSTAYNNNEDGIWLWYSDSNLIANNTAYSNTFIGIRLEYSNINNISENTVFDNQGWTGMWLQFSNSNTITNNTAFSNNGNGIDVTEVNGNIISNNTAYNNLGNGVNLWFNSINNVVTNNTVYNNSIGIMLTSSTENTISSNDAYDNNYGLYLKDSGNNAISNNNFTNNGFSLDSSIIEDSIQQVVTSNFVNGKPMIYLQSVIGGTVQGGAGQVILVNSTGVTVINQNIAKASIGIFLSFSSDITIDSNHLSSNRYGIYLEQSNGNSIVNNTNHKILFQDISLIDSDNNILRDNYLLSNNSRYGYNFQLGKLYLERSHDNSIINNTISNSLDHTIRLVESSNNVITSNLISNNTDFGLIADGTSTNNVFRFNDFLDNNIGGSQVFDDGANLFEYNYWNDWIGPDIDGDGVVDDPYLFEGLSNNMDPYPLVISPTNHYLLPPVVTSLIEGQTFSKLITLNWKPAIDTKEFGVTYNLLYSADGGATWNLIASDLIDTSFIWDISSLADGSIYKLKIDATSAGGSSNTYIMINSFSIDQTPPTVVFETPLTGTITNKIIEITLSGDATTYWYNIESEDTTNQTWTSSVTRTLADGTYTLHAYGSDQVGNIAHVQVTFIVDNIPPTVIIEAPMVQSYSSEVVTITLSGDATTYWYNIESEDTTNQTWTSSVTRTLADGTYTLHAYGSDEAGNIAHVQVTFTIDTQPPISPPTASTPTSDTTTPTASLPNDNKSDEGPFPLTQNYIILFSIFTMITLVHNKKTNK